MYNDKIKNILFLIHFHYKQIHKIKFSRFINLYIFFCQIKF